MDRFLLSTIDPAAAGLARQHGLGVELAQFCTASNMYPPDFARWDWDARAALQGVSRAVLHAPFAELSPAAIDPGVWALVRERLLRACRIAQGYGVRRMVVHAGYIPHVYFKEWFQERSLAFWRDFLPELPDGFEILLENVLEDEPYMLLELLSALSDVRLRACLDVGHARVCSSVAPERWVDALAPFLRHAHLHNNDGHTDSHCPPDEGVMDPASLTRHLINRAPEITICLETLDAARSIAWLKTFVKEGIL